MSNILIIDDEETILFSFNIILEEEGFTVFCASNAEEGISIARDNDIDLALVDLHLPEMNGEDVIFAINRIKPNIKFIIHSGDINFVVSPELESIGVKNNYILKKTIKSISIIPELISNILS